MVRKYHSTHASLRLDRRKILAKQGDAPRRRVKSPVRPDFPAKLLQRKILLKYNTIPNVSQQSQFCADWPGIGLKWVFQEQLGRSEETGTGYSEGSLRERCLGALPRNPDLGSVWAGRQKQLAARGREEVSRAKGKGQLWTLVVIHGCIPELGWEQSGGNSWRRWLKSFNVFGRDAVQAPGQASRWSP